MESVYEPNHTPRTTTPATTTTTASDNNNDCPRFRPFAASVPNLKLKVRKAKYSTSLDPRGYIPVYEYTINHQPIMWDRETGYVHFTGIWKALGNSKSDIVKMVDSNPELQVKKIRGGFLKIQGTWIPYDFAAILCRRTSYPIRKELTAIFGPKFANDALAPGHKDYGSLLLNPQRVNQMGRNSRRNSNHHSATTMRQNHHPPPPPPPASLPLRNKSTDHMSLSRLLNTTTTTSSTPQEASPTWSTSSPHTTPSPTLTKKDDNLSPSSSLPPLSLFHRGSPSTTGHSVYSTLPHPCPIPRIMPVRWQQNHHHQQQQQQKSSLFSPSPAPPPPPPPPSSSSNSSNSSTSSMDEDECKALNQDIIDTINATLLLQRLSQDDGARPFKPMSAHTVPSRVMVGDQEYKICWD